MYSYIMPCQSTAACRAQLPTCTPLPDQRNPLPNSIAEAVIGRNHPGLVGTCKPPSDCPSSEHLPPPRGHNENCRARGQLLFLHNFSIPLLPSTGQDQDGFLPAKSLSTPAPSPLSPCRLCLLAEKRLGKKMCM